MRQYLCIDLKSFYASVECVEKGLDPATTKLVVADPSRSSGTICLAISTAMKKEGVKNRCRLFEIPPDIEYIVATPRMELYMQKSAEIYGIYLKYIAKEDIHVYSIDEAFLDVTEYLSLYDMTARELGAAIIKDILDTLHLYATCGIGTNLYLAKIALDIMAKHSPDFIGELTEESYKEELWDHLPLKDFWRVGPGTVKRLASRGILTMRDIACTDEKILYDLLGVDAEILIDHANGIEPTTIADIKNYKAKTHSLSQGQVLPRNYNFEDGLLIVKEMVDLLCLDLVDKGLITDTLSLTVGSDYKTGTRASTSMKIKRATSSVRALTPYFEQMYKKLVPPDGEIRRLYIDFGNVTDEAYQQYDLFSDPVELEKDYKIQKSVNEIRKKFGNNAILRGMDLQDAATTKERNEQIGGHSRGKSRES